VKESGPDVDRTVATVLRRPPVSQSVLVRADLGHDHRHRRLDHRLVDHRRLENGHPRRLTSTWPNWRRSLSGLADGVR
jgi:hypothetical protein